MSTKPKTIGTALTRIKVPKSQTVADGLENAVAGLGGYRDKMSYNSWELPRALGRFELENMYRGSWLARKIVDIPADDMTREWRHVVFDGDDEKAAKINQSVAKAERKFGLKDKVNTALKWARLYGGALIIIGTKDGMRDPSLPLIPEAVKKGDLKYLQVLDRWRVSPDSVLTKDITSPNFGLPEHYIVADSHVKIHWSRVLRFNGAKLPHFAWLQNAMWDDPILTGIMDALANREVSTKGVATMLFEANVDVISGAGISDMLAMKGGEEKLIRRFQAAATMKSFNRTLLLDKEETYEKKSNQFSTLDKIMQEFMTDVSGASDIPITRLFGQSPAGLSSTGESDTRNYYDGLAGKQETDIRPQLEYLDEILMRSELGNMPDDFEFDFCALWQTSDLDQSTIEKNRADRDKIYLDLGVLHAGNVARELKDRGTYKTITDEDVELVNELSQPIDGDPQDPEVGFRETAAKQPTPEIDPEAGGVDPKTGKPIPPTAGVNPPKPEDEQ